MAVSMPALGAVAVGSIFAYAGIKGYSVPQAIQAIVQGKNPASTLTNAYQIETPTGGGTGTADQTTGPGGTTTVDGIVVASWFAPLIAYAKAHGWTGKLTSGYRSAADQAAACATGARPCAAPGTSHHQGIAYPDGAIDVVYPNGAGGAPEAFVQTVRGSGLQGATEIQAAGAKDPVHISIPGSHRPGEASY